MRQNTLPEEKRDCPRGCGRLLRYFKEGLAMLDLYYCEKCYRISEWDGKEVEVTQMEAYPKRDKPLGTATFR